MQRSHTSLWSWLISVLSLLASSGFAASSFSSFDSFSASSSSSFSSPSSSSSSSSHSSTLTSSFSLSASSSSSAAPPPLGCTTLPSSSLCAPLLSYRRVYISTPCYSQTETQIEQAASIWAAAPSSCLPSLSLFLCMQAYPQCNDNFVNTANSTSLPYLLPCQPTCASLTQICPGVYLSLFPSLSGLVSSPSSYCSSLPTSNCSTSIRLAPSAADTIPAARCYAYNSLPYQIAQQTPSLSGAYQACSSLLLGADGTSASYYYYLAASTAPSSATLLSLLELSQVDFLFAALPSTCAQKLALFLCTSAFPRCDQGASTSALTNGLIQIPLPNLMCRSRCEEYMNDCGLELIVLGQSSAALQQALTVNCNMNVTVVNTVTDDVCAPSPTSTPSTTATTSSASTASPAPTISPAAAAAAAVGIIAAFPVNATILALSSSVSASVSCNSYTAAQVSKAAFHPVCPAPLLPAPSADVALNGGYCAAPCVLISYSDAEYTLLERIGKVLGILGFIFDVYVLLTWLVFPSKRKQMHVVSFCISVFIGQMILMLLFTSPSPRSVGCTEDGAHVIDMTMTSTKATECIVQAVAAHYTVLAIVLWWTVIAIDLTLSIYYSHLITSAVKRKLDYTYNFIGWIVPLIFVAIALGNQSYGGHPGIIWCFFPNDSLEWPYFYWIVALAEGIVFVLMSCTLVTLYRSARRTARSANWKQHVRPVLFMFQFLFFYMFLLGIRVQIDLNKPEYTQSAVDFVTCLLGPTPSSCGDHPKSRPSLFFWYGTHAAVTFQGFVVFVVYGTQKDNLKLWLGLLRGTIGSGGSGSGSKGSNSGRGSSSGASDGKISRSGRTSGKLSLSPTGASAPTTTSINPSAHSTTIPAVALAAVAEDYASPRNQNHNTVPRSVSSRALENVNNNNANNNQNNNNGKTATRWSTVSARSSMIAMVANMGGDGSGSNSNRDSLNNNSATKYNATRSPPPLPITAMTALRPLSSVSSSSTPLHAPLAPMQISARTGLMTVVPPPISPTGPESVAFHSPSATALTPIAALTAPSSTEDNHHQALSTSGANDNENTDDGSSGSSSSSSSAATSPIGPRGAVAVATLPIGSFSSVDSVELTSPVYVYK